MKRKYKPGYYVEFGGHEKAQSTTQSQTKNNKETANVSNKKGDAPVSETLLNIEEKEAVEYPLTASNDNKVNLSATNNKNNRTTTLLNTATDIQKDAPTKPSRLKKAIISKFNKKATKKSSKEIDNLTILLIILSLFPILALIAIFIKDGKSITLNFWVDLLLHFIFLYWLFALLVVLDVINLA
jgi:hypothetical protein